MTEKKLSTVEAAKQLLANKKQQGNGKNAMNGSTSTKKLASQQTKKTSNQRRKMGV